MRLSGFCFIREGLSLWRLPSLPSAMRECCTNVALRQPGFCFSSHLSFRCASLVVKGVALPQWSAPPGKPGTAAQCNFLARVSMQSRVVPHQHAEEAPLGDGDRSVVFPPRMRPHGVAKLCPGSHVGPLSELAEYAGDSNGTRHRVWSRIVATWGWEVAALVA
jgi:hypothetical protein